MEACKTTPQRRELGLLQGYRATGQGAAQALNYGPGQGQGCQTIMLRCAALTRAVQLTTALPYRTHTVIVTIYNYNTTPNTTQSWQTPKQSQRPRSWPQLRKEYAAYLDGHRSLQESSTVRLSRTLLMNGYRSMLSRTRRRSPARRRKTNQNPLP